MTALQVLQVFDLFQKARMQFVQSLAELALLPQNMVFLEQAGALDLLLPLLSDVCVQIQQWAAAAIGTMVRHCPRFAREALNRDLIPLLIRDIEKQNKIYKRAALYVLRPLCEHDEETANVVATTGGLEAIMLCLKDFEPAVKEAAVSTVGYMTRHGQTLAQIVADAGAIPLLVLCLQGPEISLKYDAANTLSDIANHSLDLAKNVVDSGAVPFLIKALGDQDEKFKREALAALSSIAKHSNDLAEVVVEGGIYPSVLKHMAHACPIVRMNAAALVRDTVKHTLELTQLVVNTGGIGALMETLRHASEELKVPCVTALGYIAGYSDQLAMLVLECYGERELTRILNETRDDAVLAVTVSTLGQIGKHGSKHANMVSYTNAFPRLLQLYMDEITSEDLKYKCKTTLKQCLQKCMVLSQLEPLLRSSPPNILKYVLGQIIKMLPNDAIARRLFVTLGGLKKVQEIEAEPSSTLMEYITIINACFTGNELEATPPPKQDVVSITAARSRLINDSATVSFHTRFRMAQSHLTNGYTNGHIPDDIEDGSDFLFASESVENTPIRMLVVLENGEHRTIRFTLPKEIWTSPEILERVGLPFHPDSKIECTETNHSGINYLVTVGIQHLENNTNDDTPDPEELDSQANTQKADFALSTETTSETATSEPLAETETPRFVAGLLAVCNHCGYTTENFNRCPRCRNKLPDDVKTRPALKRASGINNKLANGPNKKKPKIIEQEPVVLTSSSGEEEEEEESYTNKLSETDQLIRRLSNSSVTLSAIKKEPSMSDIQQNPSSELEDTFIAVRGLYQSLQRYLDTLTRTSQVGRPKTEPPPSLDGHPSL